MGMNIIDLNLFRFHVINGSKFSFDPRADQKT